MSRAVSRRRPRRAPSPPPDPTRSTLEGLLGLAKKAGVAIVAAGAAYLAWTNLGLPWLATRDYVHEVVRPIITQVQGVNATTLNTRIEQLTASRQRAVAERLDLELKIQSKTVRDPTAIQVIQSREHDIDDLVKNLDDQIVSAKAELQRSKN